MIKNYLFLLVLFLTNIIQGITGFAGTVLAMPPSIILQGIDVAKPILNILGIVVSIWIVIISYKNLNIREFVKIVFFMLAGLILGNYLYSKISLQILLKFYAIFIISISLKGIFIKKDIDTSEFFLNITLFISGIIHGMFVSGGPLLIIYATKKLKKKTEFRATISAVWIILNSCLFFSHYKENLITIDILEKTMLSLPLVFLGLIIGNKLHFRISQNLFLLITYILLILSGVLLFV